MQESRRKMSVGGIREKTLSFECPSTMKKHRAVTVDFTAGTVAFTAAGQIPNAVSLCDAMKRDIGGLKYTVEVILISILSGTEFLTAGAAVVKGNELEVGTDGKVIPLNTGNPIGLRAYSSAAVDNEYFPAHNDVPAGERVVRKLTYECAAGLLGRRCVTLTDATATVAYTAAGDTPTHVTLGDAYLSGGVDVVDVQPIATLNGTEYVTAGAAILIGADLEVVGAVGKVQTKAAGDSIGLRAYEAAAADDDEILAYKG